MPTVQWREIPFALETPVGLLTNSLPFNAFLKQANPMTGLASQLGPQWVLDSARCGAGSGKRVSRDNKPQAGGDIVHRKFRQGLVMQLGATAVEVLAVNDDDDLGAMNSFQPACAADLVAMWDDLMRRLQSIENADGRLFWTPTGQPVRMMDRARWLGPDGGGGGGFQSVAVEREDEVWVNATFAFLCPFPYGMDFTQNETAFVDGVPQTITQAGTCAFAPVWKVDGFAEYFEIRNLTTNRKLVYDSGYPGATYIDSGQFVEFDFFRETAYFDGDGASAKPGIVVMESDFWDLEYGDNSIELFGASGTMLWQNAWTG